MDQHDPPQEGAIIITPGAAQDIAAAVQWYDLQAGLGTAFYEAVATTINRIVDTPLGYRKIRGDVRRALLRRFPYGLVYMIDQGTVVVLACYHGRQNPRSWLAAARTRRRQFRKK